MPSFIVKVKNTIKKYSLFSENDKLIVAVSGGADSVTLLFLLFFLKKEYNLDISVAHFNHQIRLKEAEADALFVQEIAAKLNLPFVLKKRDVPLYAKRKKLSLEEAARNLRYEFLEETAKAKGANKIALGHNKNDQVETILMRLLRGGGSQGLGGMLPKRLLAEKVSIIRPLIETSRQEILDFLKQKKIKFREDKTNKETIYLRNRIRYRLIPYLGRYNPRIEQILFNTAENLREENGYLEQVAQEAFSQISQYEDKKVTLSLYKLNKLHPVLQKRVLRLAIKGAKGNTKEITYQHWQTLDLLINKNEGNLFLDLPQIRIQKKNDKVIFLRSKPGMRPKKIKTNKGK
ncbi:MAG: tRNA lysidine(34) synthetase TilS [Candidatus Omnitrophica bacterium]|nr:tRNA lysidine(34) synthetase TilS [Candidatus Omnitrophota bacterium]